MAEIRARGIIIKQSDYGEGHRMLTVFTEEYGIVKAVSYGVKKSKSKAPHQVNFCVTVILIFTKVSEKI